MSCPNALEPLPLVWSNNTVSNDGKAVNNGMVVFVGTPPQRISVTPSFSINNTLINNVATCNSPSNASCASILGGVFDPDKSSTYRVSSLDAFNGSQEGGTATYLVNAPYVFFNDALEVSSDKALPGFPIVMETDVLQYAALGLGTNSTFISRLSEANLIPSKSVSVYTGVYSSVKAGAVVVGGYSEQFYEGQLYSDDVYVDHCTACFNVTGLQWKDSNGTLDLMSDLPRRWFTAIVDPYQPYMVLPSGAFNAIKNRTEAFISTPYALLAYLASRVPEGELVVTLSNGLETTIPNHALFDPPAYDAGILQINRNNSEVYGLMANMADAYGSSDPDLPAILGVSYAAFVYIIRDFERNNISIAHAANVTAATFPSEFTAICSPGSSSSHHNNTAATAGGVVGGILGLALLCLGLWWFLRRKKSKQVKELDAMEASLRPDHKSADGSSRGSPEDSIGPFSELFSHSKFSELSPNSSVHEAPIRLAKQEMPPEGTTMRQELPG